jgi:hypothetical protein
MILCSIYDGMRARPPFHAAGRNEGAGNMVLAMAFMSLITLHAGKLARKNRQTSRRLKRRFHSDGSVKL